MKINQQNSTRRYDLDWLRVSAILIVFLYHSMHFFDTADWSVKNATRYDWIGTFGMRFMEVFMMPLIFLISGASIFYAASKSNALGFIRDKFFRLFVPLFIGVFSFSIMQVYLERITHQQYHGSFIEFIPHYFEGIYVTDGTGNFAFHGMHLWYLLFLFIFTLVFMPLFWWFKSKKGSYFLGRLGDILAVRGLLILLLLPTILLQNIMSNEGGLVVGGWQMSQYIWFFLAGYLIFSHQKLQLQIVKTRWVWAMLSVCIISVSIYYDKGPANHADILVWLELLAIIGFAMKHLNFSNEFLDYSREAVMPFYILHQNLLLLLGYFIVKLMVLDLIKFLIIVVGTLVTIMVLYECCIRRCNAVRVMFGMKRKKQNNTK